jgi:transaldolase
MPPADVLAEIDAQVDQRKLEAELLREGIVKFAEPQTALLKLIAGKRRSLVRQQA